MTTLSAGDRTHLHRCVELAEAALVAGDDPFGSVLVDAHGTVLFEDRNREITGGDATLHPEFEIARWAAGHLTAEERRQSTVYTSGEHCPMCSSAHAWVGLGRIVYATSTAQLTAWRRDLGYPPGPVVAAPITAIAPGVEVAGPDPELAPAVRALHERRARN